MSDLLKSYVLFFFFFSSRRRHTRYWRDWSSDVCSSDLELRVLVDETRPFLQGSRLTAWELREAGIPLTLITDSMAAHFMGRGEVDCIMVGADRIVANGDVPHQTPPSGPPALPQARQTTRPNSSHPNISSALLSLQPTTPPPPPP